MNNILKLISPNRLNVYKKFFEVSTDQECLGLYFWNQKINNEFNSAIQIIEISLRNSIMSTINEKRPELSGDNFINHFKGLVESNESRRQIEYAEKKCQKKNNYSINDIVALLPFGFWANLCSNEHDATNPDSLQLWPTHENDIFPTLSISMGALYENISRVNALRNRISHHEVIWKNKNAFHTDWLTNTIIDNYTACLEVAKSIHIDNLKLFEIIEGINNIEVLCQEETITKYKNLITDFSSTPVIDVGRFHSRNIKNTIYSGEITSINKKNIYLRSKQLTDSDGKQVKFKIDKDIIKELGKLIIRQRVEFEPYVIRDNENIIYIAKKVKKL